MAVKKIDIRSAKKKLVSEVKKDKEVIRGLEKGFLLLVKKLTKEMGTVKIKYSEGTKVKKVKSSVASKLKKLSRMLEAGAKKLI